MPTALLLWGFAYCLGVFWGDGFGVRWEVARILLGAGAGLLGLALAARRWHGWALLFLTFAVGVTAQARRPGPLALQALRQQLEDHSAAQPGPARSAHAAPRPGSDGPWLWGGQVVEAPSLAAGGTLIRLALDELGPDAAASSLAPIRPALPVHVLLRGEPREPLAPGDRVRLRASLHPPLGRRNPDAPDAQRLALGRDIAAYASALPDALVRWQAGPAPSPSTLLARAELSAARAIAWLRTHLRAAVSRSFASQPGLDPVTAREREALVQAVALGDRGALQQADAAREQRGQPTLERLFRAAGIAHVLSVSGLHLSVATWLGFVALAWGLRRSAWLAQRCEVRRLAAAAGVPLAILYTALTGAALPTVRALGAACLGLVALALGRRVRPAEAMVAAVLWLVLPWHAGNASLLCFEPSLQLSVAATWALAFLRPLGGLPARLQTAPGRPAVRTLSAAPLALGRLTFRLIEGSIAAMLATLPLCALYFSSVQGATLLGNLLVVPLIELGVLPAGLLGAAVAPVHPGLGAPLLALSGRAAACAVALAAKLARLGWEIVVPAPPKVVLGLWALGLLGLLARRRLGWLLLGAALGLLGVLARAAPGKLVLTALDVGQGDGIVVELPHGGVMVIDAGLRAGDADAGRAVVAPFLRRRGYRRIDVLVASHPHPDHIGGLLTLLDQFEVGELWTAAEPIAAHDDLSPPGAGPDTKNDRRSDALWAELLARAARRGVPVTAPRSGRLGGAGLQVLGPCRETESSLPCRAAACPGLGHNDNSIVLRLSFAGRTLLLPGDIEGPGELALLERARGEGAGGAASGTAAASPAGTALLRADVLKAPHHCSRTSSSEALLASVRPQAVICSVGQGNRFGFPHPDVVARYKARGVAILRTDRDGAVQVTVPASGKLEIATTVAPVAAAAESTAIVR